VLTDIRTMACLGKYYAHKIQGATELALFRKTQKEAHQNAAIRELNQAAGYWRLYVSTALGQYKNPLWMNRVGHCDWRKLFREVLRDIEIAGGTPDVASMFPTPGGTLLEAESTQFEGARLVSTVPAFSGTGYLEFGSKLDAPHVEWTFQAPEAGTYLLELRYLYNSDQQACPVQVNGKDAGSIILWPSGGPSTWAWDRKIVQLKKGKNTVGLVPKGAVLIDHLNVLSSSPRHKQTLN
jgi:hypothetical protein